MICEKEEVPLPHLFVQQQPVCGFSASSAPPACSWLWTRTRKANRRGLTAASGRPASGARPCTTGSLLDQERRGSRPRLSAWAPHLKSLSLGELDDTDLKAPNILFLLPVSEF